MRKLLTRTTSCRTERHPLRRTSRLAMANTPLYKQSSKMQATIDDVPARRDHLHEIKKKRTP